MKAADSKNKLSENLKQIWNETTSKTRIQLKLFQEKIHFPE